MLRPGALPDCLKHLGQPEDSYRSQFLRTIDNGVGIFLFLLIFKYSCRSKNCVCGHFYLLAPAFVLLFLECFLKHWHLSAFHRILHKHLKNPSQREQHHFFFFNHCWKSPYKSLQSIMWLSMVFFRDHSYLSSFRISVAPGAIHSLHGKAS